MNQASVTGQMMVDQGPKFEMRGVIRKPKNFHSSNQVLNKRTNIIRPDKRKKAKYL